MVDTAAARSIDVRDRPVERQGDVNGRRQMVVSAVRAMRWPDTEMSHPHGTTGQTRNRVAVIWASGESYELAHLVLHGEQI